jgi:hypothetical protein
MTEVDELFSAFVAAERAGEEPDPREFLGRASDTAARAELGALLEAHLERAPRREFNAERYRGSRAEAVMESLTGPAGTWPQLLPRLRDEAQLPRDMIVTRLAAALGLSGREAKVHRYYHEMEHGRLPSSGVSQRVLEALGQILGTSADALRRAGEGLGDVGGGAGSPDAPPAFARAAPASAGSPAPARESDASDDEWDDVDELFRGG